MSAHNNVAWSPSKEWTESTRLFRWMQSLGYDTYDPFYEKSCSDTAWFWNEAVKELNIDWYEPYQQTLDLSEGIAYPNWFVNGKMNVAYNAVEKWALNPNTANKIAVIWEGDDQQTTSYTYRELNQLVNRAAHGFEQLGITQGDVIAIYMPMIPETLITMLAASKIGAIFSPAFSGYKADAIATRLNAAKAKVLVTADGFFRRGKIIPMKEEADKAADQATLLEHVVVVNRANRKIEWNEQRDVQWDHINRNETDYSALHTNGNDSFMIIYTSGTTGKPKGALHSHAGFPIKSAFDAGICMDVHHNDTLFWFTDMGWMMGPFLVYGGLLNGATIVMFEGTPDHPGPDRLWQLVEQHQVTHLGISPTLIRSMMHYGTKWIEPYDLSKLKVIGSTGEPWNPEPWNWLFYEVGKGKVPIFNYSGGTEISGGILGNVLVKPIQPVTFNAALPGMDVNVFDSEGNSVQEQVGELVLTKPWVGMTNGFYQENERYENTYWNRWKDTWVHGDWVIQDRDGYYTITGRSDDTLNVAGKRLGPAEVESVLVEHDAVMEAGVIGVPHDVKGEVAVAFVVLQPNKEQSESLKNEMFTYLQHKLGKALAPKDIYFIRDLPKTRNAKVMRRAIKTAFLNTDSGDLSALENPETVQEIRSIGNAFSEN
ncbi:AMP-binding protein [Aquibacillus sp. 3ASR75-11]|uniref:acetate--CoA ligase n=1 Tax=Terrihalobacillus insolitus TaxID=2950438 RepID=A0A9X4AMX4_9BACI|nr:AMP-binding protein [Terrihalobacillus insolitus]MDC3425902.1 AMP-binding protein [Terrihalobacillus insolitus]